MAFEIPDDLILPPPQDGKEEGFFKTLKDYANSISKAFLSLQDVANGKVKATSTDPTADYLDGKVDNVTIEVSANKLQVKSGWIDGTLISGLAGTGLSQSVGGELYVNVDDDTIEINANTLRAKDNGIDGEKIRLDNNQYLVGLNQAGNAEVNIVKLNTLNYAEIGTYLTLTTGVEINEFSSDTTLSGNSDIAVPTEKAVKTYVDSNINGSLSNCIFEWHGQSTIQGTDIGHCSSTTIGGTATGQYVSMRNTTTSYATVLEGKFTKLSGISTITIQAQIMSNGADTTSVLVDIGGQSNSVTTTSGTPAWATSSNIDVSGLSNGTTYDITVQIKNSQAATISYLFDIQLIAS